ncbi:pyocin knob domain-containing protein [Escherichia coli]|uniref:pyocin knob domain-containing protein n=3 Tax=Escherichia coli TaxID=562 RepID=UPI00191ABBEA|nr:pyocin knob domain-containing protein [Escherichia coli]CAD6037483.1 putative tail fiber protein [Escherichia coli]
MILGFGNNTKSSLATDITEKQTTLSVLPGTGTHFARLLTRGSAGDKPVDGMYAKLTLTNSSQSVFEICHLTAVEQDTLTVIRGQEGTEARAWVLNDIVANFATRGSEENFVQAEQLQSGWYTTGVAGGTENALTLALPTTAFVNGGDAWVLKGPVIIYPVSDNTGACTLELTMGDRVVGTFPLHKGGGQELVAGDIKAGAPVLCLLDDKRSYFSVLNPGRIYSDDLYLLKDQDGADVPDKPLFIKNIGAVPDTREVNGHALSGDVTLSADDVGAMPLHGQIPAGTDLNTLDGTRKGYYYQGGNAGATLALHYPVAQAGYLRVVPNGANGAAGCAQEYVPYTSSVVYRRNHAANTSTWGEWIADYNAQNPPPNTGYTKAESDARYVQDEKLGSEVAYTKGSEESWTFHAPAGCIMTGIIVQDTGSNTADNIGGVYYKPLQIYINGAWRTISG